MNSLGQYSNPSKIDSDEEYDPLQPTRYDLLLKDRANIVKKQTMNELSEKKAQSALQKAEELIRRMRTEGVAMTQQINSLNSPGVPPPVPPQVLKTAEVSAEPSVVSGESFLKKMGWERGGGLGVLGHGMKNPLEATMVDADTAVIKEAESIFNSNKTSQTQLTSQMASPASLRFHCGKGLLFGRPSRILCLGNIAQRDTVSDDASLEDEILEELSKYGNLIDVKIKVAPTQLIVQKYEEVRIFCEFEAAEEAQNALDGIQGRLFNGRQVVAVAYSEAIYNKGQYFVS